MASASQHPNHRDAASLPAELRRVTVPGAVLDWVARETGSAVRRFRRLPGASSTAVHRLDLADGARLVLRRYVWPGFLEDEPVAPRRELDALRLAARHRLPAPAVVAADVDGSRVGDGVPVVLMTLVPGRAVAAPDPERLAEVAATIHAVGIDSLDAGGFPHEYFPWYEGTTTEPPTGATRPALWEEALGLWHRGLPAYEPTFVHRDFHPGNVLWSRGRATGVVDWANACRGPWACDIATCRTNLIWLGDPGAADRFLRAYESATGRTYDPYWEMASVLEQGQSWSGPADVLRDERRLERALRAL